MAKRHFSVGVGSFLFGCALMGCHQTAPSATLYPSPSFDAPKVVARPAVAPHPAYVPTYAAVAPVTGTKAIFKSAFPMTGIPAAWSPPVSARPWQWIIIHHSATTTGGALAFDKIHRAKGWDELGYDFVIGNGTDTANGQIEVGPRWTKQKIGAHAKSADNRFNEYGIGICLVGNFELERPTAKQMDSVEKLVGYLMATYHVTPDHILRHKDTKSTECPGKYLSIDVIRRQASLLGGPSVLVKNTAPRGEMLTSISTSR